MGNVVVRGRVFFGRGWALHPTRRISRLGVVRAVVGGGECVFAEYGGSSPDLHAKYPDAPNGWAAGLFVYGLAATDLIAGEPFRWFVEYADGGREEKEVPTDLVFLNPRASGDEAGILHRAARAFGSLVGRRPTTAPEDGISEGALISLSKMPPCMIVLDHDLGGGANLNRRNFVERCLGEGRSCIVVTWSLSSLSYSADIHFETTSVKVSFASEHELWSWLERIAVCQVMLNNIASFPAPLEFISRLQVFVQAKSAALSVMVNDYQVVCPSWHLLDQRGVFCGIPESISTCEDCFRANPVLFKGALAASSVADWRSIFGGLVSIAAEVRCFSESSKALVLRAHPDLDPTRVTVVPHRLVHVRNRRVVVDVHAPIRIGVVGNLVKHKGSVVVLDLAEAIRRSRSDARVIVIGTIALNTGNEGITVTGHYAPRDLPQLFERHGINVVLFPSICPETFSYACEEVMQMDVPLIAFDLGAPPERIRNYRRGRVVPVLAGDRLLQEIVSFIDELRLEETVAKRSMAR